MHTYLRDFRLRFSVTVKKGGVTITTENSTDGATSLSNMNLSGYVEHMTIFS